MRWPLGVAVAAFGVAAVAELTVALRPPLAEVSASDVAEAAALVVAEKAPGEQVLHSPLFGLTALGGLGRLEARPDLPPPSLRWRRLWVIDRSGETMYVPGAARTERARFGDVVVWTAEPEDPPEPDEGVRFDLYRDLGPGMMRVERPVGNVVSTCDRPRSGGGYACPGQAEWVYAARHEQTIDGAPKSCVWAHPITNAAVVIELPPPPSPPPGAHLELTVGAGLSDGAVKTPDGASVRTKIRQVGTQVRTLVVPNRRGWFEETLRVRDAEPIRLVITTAHDGVRHHCMNAAIRVVEDEAP